MEEIHICRVCGEIFATENQLVAHRCDHGYKPPKHDDRPRRELPHEKWPPDYERKSIFI